MTVDMLKYQISPQMLSEKSRPFGSSHNVIMELGYTYSINSSQNQTIVTLSVVVGTRLYLLCQWLSPI